MVQRSFITALKFSWVIDRPDTNNHTLADHEAWHRLIGANRARVGEAHVGTLEIVNRQFVGAHLAHDVVVGQNETQEVEGVCAIQHRHHECALAVALVDINRQTEVHIGVALQLRFAVGVCNKGILHVWYFIDHRTHDRVSDEMREADFCLTRARAIAVDDTTVDFEQLGRNLAHARGSGHRQAALHVCRDCCPDATNRFGLTRWCQHDGGGRWCGLRWCN